MVDLTSYQTVTLLESRAIIENGTTGMHTWLASFVLSQYIILHPGIVARKCVLELGCGVGLLGMIVASQQLSPSRTIGVQPGICGALWMSDINEEVLTRCSDNFQLPCNPSSLHPRVRYRILDWTHALDPSTLPHLQSVLQDEIDAEVILGADLVFNPTLIPGLVGVLCLALQTGQSCAKKTVITALSLRNEETFTMFLQIAADQSLVVEDIHFQFDRTMFLGTLEEDIKICKITLKA